MLIPLEEFRTDLDKYMNIARIRDVYITDDSKQATWVLTSVKDTSWPESLLSLIFPDAQPRAAATQA